MPKCENDSLWVIFQEKNDVSEKKVATLAHSVTKDASAFPESTSCFNQYAAEVLYEHFSFLLTKYEKRHTETN